MLTDSYRHKGLRKKLVDELSKKGIFDKKVLDAINAVPRHFFMDFAIAPEIAYSDKAIPIDCKQTISQPFTVAFQTQLLELKNKDKILEIGTGSGYQTAVLCQLKSNVFTIERQHNLFIKAKTLLISMGYKPKCYFGDGYLGLQSCSPFDKILVTCGAPQIPDGLIKQLKVGGIMIIPIGEETQIMYKIVKISENELKKEALGDYKFVPMLEELEMKKS
ncbi:MAG: protein-L-isoaspartate(D-aspartate) O-methyltransferase [Bacteroidales bacterium]|jgi:protein-L-isoaspartate(D-aspartate) O-methyltransferase|nr:protein-L-isoaspartate(D-aspartate) O-methyltransferase [Bacteroidales bacterium]